MHCSKIKVVCKPSGHEILRPVDVNAPALRLNNAKGPNSLEQELMNILVRSMALKPLEEAAMDHCQKGHDERERGSVGGDPIRAAGV